MKRLQNREWMGLDNAAKIFPPTSSKTDPRVFRFACELKEEVDPLILQKALNQTIDLFPIFRSILKRGVFWYYLEISDLDPLVQEETKPPCSRIYNRNKKTLLFHVTYFKKRMNLEVYHVLTDGAGALQFLRMLVYQYLKIKYKKVLGKISPIDYDASSYQKITDSFQKYYEPHYKKQKFKLKHAYQLKGFKYPEQRMKIIEGIVSVSAMHKKAKEYQTTITVLLASILLCAIEQEMENREKKRPIILTIPVNLRNYFDSKSVRNFFSIAELGYNFTKGSSQLDAVVAFMKQQFEQELTEEKMKERMTSLSALEHNVFARAIPLVVKDFCMKYATKITDRGTTASLSNVGKVDLPNELAPYINLFDVFISTNKLQACVCSYQDNLTITFTSIFKNTDVQMNFFRMITSMDIPVEIRCNNIDGE